MLRKLFFHTRWNWHRMSWVVLITVLLVLALSVVPPTSLARLPATLQPVVVTLPADGSITVVVDAFCLDYGLPFPDRPISPGDIAPVEVRLAISHGVAQGYTQSAPYQVQLAIWHLDDGLWHDEDHDLAAEIVAYAQSGAEPPDAGLAGTPLPEAVSSGIVSATFASFYAVSTPAYQGQGTLVLSNLTDSEQVINFPYGTVFAAEPPLTVQTMVVYAVAPFLPPAGAERALRGDMAVGVLLAGAVLLAAGCLLHRVHS
jgi:hypothetical protein